MLRHQTNNQHWWRDQFMASLVANFGGIWCWHRADENWWHSASSYEEAMEYAYS